jgi:hypothetical protein
MAIKRGIPIAPVSAAALLLCLAPGGVSAPMKCEWRPMPFGSGLFVGSPP